MLSYLSESLTIQCRLKCEHLIPLDMKMGEGASCEVIFLPQVQCGESERRTTAFAGVEEDKMRSFCAINSNYG